MTATKFLMGISPIALMIAATSPGMATTGTTEPTADRTATATDGQDKTITITATRTEKAVEDVPATVSVIDAKTIEDRFVSDIKDLVRYEPGVTVRRAPSRFTAAGSSTGRDRDSGFTSAGSRVTAPSSPSTACAFPTRSASAHNLSAAAITST
jgi:hemoglobin/transferrin/lactoferrin receptor protein